MGTTIEDEEDLEGADGRVPDHRDQAVAIAALNRQREMKKGATERHSERDTLRAASLESQAFFLLKESRMAAKLDVIDVLKKQ